MEITDRQSEILKRIVEKYIDSAEPVSSKLLEKEYRFDVCPATIRIEMQKLTDAGLIYQPHTSAGRVPTDKGYRFFVDNLLEEKIKETESEMEKFFKDDWDNSFRMLQHLTRNLASISSNLVLGYLEDENIFWKEGWEKIVKEPEFKEPKVVSNFAKTIEDLEEKIGDLKINSKVKVYIGKENPFSRAKDFSIVISKFHFPEDKGFLAIVGPKRMSYDRNIGLINQLTKLLSEI